MQIEVSCVWQVESEVMHELFWIRTKRDRAHCRRTGACLCCVLQQLARTAKLLACFLVCYRSLALRGVACLCCDAKRVFLAVFVVLEHRNRILKDKKRLQKSYDERRE